MRSTGILKSALDTYCLKSRSESDVFDTVANDWSILSNLSKALKCSFATSVGLQLAAGDSVGQCLSGRGVAVLMH